MEEREKITHKTRKVEIERGPNGFGFVLRGAKADGPISEFTPCPTCPAVQYLESVDSSGPAWVAGLRPGDFIVEINGISVIRAGHRQAVELIRSAVGILRLTATSVVRVPNDESRVATLRRRPQSRQMSSAEIQEMLQRQGNSSGTISQASKTDSKPRIPKVPDTTSLGSSTTTSSSFGLRQTRHSRSTSPSPSTNSDQSSSSRNSDKTDISKKSKPPPPKRGQSKLTCITSEPLITHPSRVITPTTSPTLSCKPMSPITPIHSMSTFEPNIEHLTSPIESPTFQYQTPTIPLSPKIDSQNQIEKPEKPKRPEKIFTSKTQCQPVEVEKDKLMDELNRSMVTRRARLESTRSDDSINENDTANEGLKSINYENLEELENEIDEIAKRTTDIDQNSPFAIAMSAKHRTLTKRRDKMKRPSLPRAEEITQRIKEETIRKDQELHYSSEESGSNEVMRRFLDSPTKYPFDIPEPVLDSGVETIGSNSTGSDRDEKHQQFLALKMRLKERSCVSTWSCIDVCEWLSENGFGQYAPQFTDNEIIGEHLTGLTKDDLKELGVTRMGHRISIMKLIERLKVDTTV